MKAVSKNSGHFRRKLRDSVSYRMVRLNLQLRKKQHGVVDLRRLEVLKPKNYLCLFFKALGQVVMAVAPSIEKVINSPIVLSYSLNAWIHLLGPVDAVNNPGSGNEDTRWRSRVSQSAEKIIPLRPFICPR